MNARNLLLIVITLMLMLIPRLALAQDETVPKVVSGEIIPCPMPLDKDDVDGETVICGQIQVPENWADPDSPLITLTYARLVSDNLSPIADPILFFAGGPGGSVLASQGSSGFDFDYLRETRDVIVWDQRGTRYSTDLRCPEDVRVPDAAAMEAASAELGDPVITLETDPQIPLDVSRALMEIEGYANCVDYFAAEGRDLNQYNTDNTIQDAIALMNHLGDPSYNFFGISYGTQVALAIMDYYEKNPDVDLPPIRSVLIDGLFPQNLPIIEDPLTKQHNILRMFSNCEADVACSVAYPDIRQRFIDLLASLEAEPVVSEDGSEVTLANVIEVLNTAVAPPFELVPYLPRMVDELERGETTTYDVATGIINGQIAAVPEPEVVESTNPLEPLMLEAAALAEQIRAIADEMDTLGQTTGLLAEAIDEAESLPELFNSIVDGYLADASPEDRTAFGGRVLALYGSYPERRNRAGTLRLVDPFPDAIAAELRSVVNLMSDAELLATWETLLDDEALQTLQAIGNLTNFTVKCNDRGPAFNIEKAFERYREFDAPQLIVDFYGTANYQAFCELIGQGGAEYAVAPAVTSDLRTLVMNAELDHSTAVEFGELAFETLTNALMVTVPMTDHGATRYHECTQDIAHTFFLYPDSELDMSCVEDLRPVFVLPEDELPGVSAQ